MRDTITITSKGQTTLPAPIRRKLGLEKDGGLLQIRFNEQSGEAVIFKAASLTEISQQLSGHIKPGVRPLKNVDDFYQNNRETEL